MGIEDPNELHHVDRAIRLNEAAARRRELGLQPDADLPFDLDELDEDWQEDDSEQEYRCMADFPDSPCHGMTYEEAVETYGQSIADWEFGRFTCPHNLLTEAGVDVPPPETLSDEDVSERLWRIINKLAEHHVFFYHTDHLSDRAFYTAIYEDILYEGIRDLPIDPKAPWECWSTDFDMCNDCDVETYLRYYADEQERAFWADDDPELRAIQRIPTPYDRDRILPRLPDPPEGAGGDWTPDDDDDDRK